MPALPPLLASSLSGRARRRAAAVGLALGVLMVVLGWRAQGDAPPPAEDRHLSLTPAAPYLLVDPSALGVAGARVALDAPGFLAVARCGDVRALLDGVSVAEPADLGTASAPVRAGAGHGPDPRRSDIWAVIGAAGDRGVLTVAAGTGAPTLASASPAASSPAASSSAASSPAASASSAASAAPSGAGTAPPPSELVVWPPAALITPVRSAASWCSVAATDGTAAAPALTLTVPSARAAGESGRSGPRWWLVLPGLALAVGAGMVLVGRAPGRAGAPDAPPAAPGPPAPPPAGAAQVPPAPTGGSRPPDPPSGPPPPVRVPAGPPPPVRVPAGPPPPVRVPPGPATPAVVMPPGVVLLPPPIPDEGPDDDPPVLPFRRRP